MIIIHLDDSLIVSTKECLEIKESLSIVFLSEPNLPLQSIVAPSIQLSYQYKVMEQFA